MTKLREALINAAVSVLDENLDSSKEMIQQNVVPSFEEIAFNKKAVNYEYHFDNGEHMKIVDIRHSLNCGNLAEQANLG